jgi:hypothetical protein
MAALTLAVLCGLTPTSIQASPREECQIIKISGQRETLAGRCPCLNAPNPKRCAKQQGIASEVQISRQTQGSGGISYGARTGSKP